MFTTNELVFTFGGFYVCANFVENPSRNASVKVHSDGYTDVANWFYYIICPYYML